jgi:DNA polymerase I-like protein with 3'-5' exonuclease and polymerase domains
MFDFFEELNRPQVKKKPWMEQAHFELVKPETLDAVIDECIASAMHGLDTETTGLDTRVFYDTSGNPSTVVKIVGYCLAPTPDRGYYIPVRHMQYKGKGEYESHPANLPVRAVVQALQRLVQAGKISAFHNAKYDHEVLQHEDYGGIGEWDDPTKWEDSLIMAYIRNSRERNKSLKTLSRVELGREMIELKELFNKDEVEEDGYDFSTLDPTWEPVLWYACSDAMCTLALVQHLLPQICSPDAHGLNTAAIYKIEKACLSATRWMERNRIPIDRSKVEELIRIGMIEWWDCLKSVYAEVNAQLQRDVRPNWVKAMMGETSQPWLAWDPSEPGAMPYMEKRSEAMSAIPDDGQKTDLKSVPSLENARVMESVAFPWVYDVTIPEVLGNLFRELGVPGLVATEKSKQVKTSKDVLAKIIDAHAESYPFMSKIARFREVAKALSSNLLPIYEDTSEEKCPDGRVWVNFNAFKVDTGRFSTPAPREGDFHGQIRWNLHSIPAGHDKKKPACMRRMREIIRVGDNKVLFAIDFSGVELRIVTNLSGEPKWVTEFFRCGDCGHTFEVGDDIPPFCPNCGSDKIGDLHTLTARTIYGDDVRDAPDFKLKRGNSKALNFAMCYGGGGSAAQRAVGVDKEEGWRIKNQFDKGYAGLQKWWKQQHEYARKTEYVVTAFGRKYPLPDINHKDGGFRSQAERNAINGPVQGTSADIMKLAMVLIYRELKKRGWLEKVKMLITIHDELVFEVDRDIADDAIDLIVPIMIQKSVAPLKWKVGLQVDIEFGQDWTVPYNLTQMEYGKIPWPEQYIDAFPRRFAKSKGKVIDTVKEPGVAQIKRMGDTPMPPAATNNDGVWVYVIPDDRLSIPNAKKLAKVMAKAMGRGTSKLEVHSSRGEVLYDGDIKVSPNEFKMLCSYEGL